MTDKIYKDIKVFRFAADIGHHKDLEVRSSGPVPIFNDEGKILGFATIVCDGRTSTVAECAIDPSNPERLEIETDRPYYLDGALEYRGFVSTPEGFMATVVWVRALRLTTKPGESTPRVVIRSAE